MAEFIQKLLEVDAFSTICIVIIIVTLIAITVQLKLEIGGAIGIGISSILLIGASMLLIFSSSWSLADMKYSEYQTRLYNSINSNYAFTLDGDDISLDLAKELTQDIGDTLVKYEILFDDGNYRVMIKTKPRSYSRYYRRSPYDTYYDYYLLFN